MTSEELNKAIGELDDDQDKVPYFGWWWREVDFDADHVYLAASPSSAPDWFGSSFESMVGKPWQGRMTRFCENNKWGYPMFKVEGEQWAELKQLVEAVVADPSDNAQEVNALRAHLITITPDEADLEDDW